MTCIVYSIYSSAETCDPKVGQIGPQMRQFGPFQVKVVPFGANLIQFGVKFDMTDSDVEHKHQRFS